MTDGVLLVCGSCGGAIRHECGAIPDANQAQSLTQTDANAEIAHGSEALGPSTPRSYNKGYDQGFLLFWNDYPRKRDKRKAQIAWRKSVSRLAQSSGANRDDAMAQISAGAIRYRDDPNRVEQFTKYAEGWLNGDGWEDEPLPVRTDNGRPVAPTRPIAFYEPVEPDADELAAFAAAASERPWKPVSA